MTTTTQTRRTYQCEMCQGVFEFTEDWTEDDAKVEAESKGIDVEDAGIVCDDCYKLTPWGSV